MENNFRFLIYRSAEEDVSVNAIVKDESIWLSQQGMAEPVSYTHLTLPTKA